MQKTLGGAFNGAWSAWARKAAYSQGSAWANIKSNPRLNTAYSNATNSSRHGAKWGTTPRGWTENTNSTSAGQ
eukprot:212945-Pyramimonas_sp.AAC.1